MRARNLYGHPGICCVTKPLVEGRRPQPAIMPPSRIVNRSRATALISTILPSPTAYVPSVN